MRVKGGLLLPKQKRFCEAYVQNDHDVKGAAKVAGYASVQLCRDMLGRNPRIKKYITTLEETKNAVIAKKFAYSAAESFDELKRAQKIALKTTKANVMFKGTKLIHTPAPDLPSFIRAEELKGKLGGLYQPEEQVQKPTTIMNIIRYPGQTGKPISKGKKKK